MKNCSPIWRVMEQFVKFDATIPDWYLGVYRKIQRILEWEGKQKSGDK